MKILAVKLEKVFVESQIKLMEGTKYLPEHLYPK